MQLLASILADDIAAPRCELYGDFFLGHWIARIALGNIVECDSPLFVVMVTRLGWNLGKSASNSWLATTFTLSMIGISALSSTRSSLNCSGVSTSRPSYRWRKEFSSAPTKAARPRNSGNAQISHAGLRLKSPAEQPVGHSCKPTLGALQRWRLRVVEIRHREKDHSHWHRRPCWVGKNGVGRGHGSVTNRYGHQGAGDYQRCRHDRGCEAGEAHAHGHTAGGFSASRPAPVHTPPCAKIPA